MWGWTVCGWGQARSYQMGAGPDAWIQDNRCDKLAQSVSPVRPQAPYLIGISEYIMMGEEASYQTSSTLLPYNNGRPEPEEDPAPDPDVEYC